MGREAFRSLRCCSNISKRYRARPAHVRNSMFAGRRGSCGRLIEFDSRRYWVGIHATYEHEHENADRALDPLRERDAEIVAEIVFYP